MHPFIKWTLVVLTPFALWIILSAVRSGHLRPLYEQHVRQTRRERIFLASLSFFLGFAAVRLLTHAIRNGLGPFHDVSVHGRHIHHLVWGILLLLLVGYSWLNEVGTGAAAVSQWTGRFTSMLYGVAAALTLDEFALWLNLKDVYWERQGRESYEAMALFGGLLAIGVLGAPFFRGLLSDIGRLFTGRKPGTK